MATLTVETVAKLSTRLHRLSKDLERWASTTNRMSGFFDNEVAIPVPRDWCLHEAKSLQDLANSLLDSLSGIEYPLEDDPKEDANDAAV